MNKTKCGCQPGSPENNWFEIRSKECLIEEREQWARAMSLFSEYSKLLKN